MLLCSWHFLPSKAWQCQGAWRQYTTLCWCQTTPSHSSGGYAQWGSVFSGSETTHYSTDCISAWLFHTHQHTEPVWMLSCISAWIRTIKIKTSTWPQFPNYCYQWLTNTNNQWFSQYSNEHSTTLLNAHVDYFLLSFVKKKKKSPL